MLTKVLPIIIASALAAPAMASSVYYLSPQGNDARDGKSTATAWQTTNKVNASNFGPGDSLMIDGGHGAFAGCLTFTSPNVTSTPAANFVVGVYNGTKWTLNSNCGSDGILQAAITIDGVSGIVVHGKGARFFVPMETAQEIAGAAKRVSMIYVRSTGNTEAVRTELIRLLPGYRIRSMAEYMSLMTSSSLPELRPFLRSFVGLGVVISFLVVLLTMYTLVLERRREIGILKAIGASRLEICWLIVAEALMLVALGVVVGLAGTYGTTTLLHHTSPTLQIQITADWIFRSILVAIAGALAGAAYPAIRAAQSDPIAALAYE